MKRLIVIRFHTMTKKWLSVFSSWSTDSFQSKSEHHMMLTFDGRGLQPNSHQRKFQATQATHWASSLTFHFPYPKVGLQSLTPKFPVPFRYPISLRKCWSAIKVSYWTSSQPALLCRRYCLVDLFQGKELTQQWTWSGSRPPQSAGVKYPPGEWRRHMGHLRSLHVQIFLLNDSTNFSTSVPGVTEIPSSNCTSIFFKNVMELPGSLNPAWETENFSLHFLRKTLWKCSWVPA